MNTSTETSSSQLTDKLTNEQKDFICRKIAAFMRIRDIIDVFQSEFTESKLNQQELYNKIHHIGTTKRTDKWRKKIEAYRLELRKKPLNRFAVANTFERLRILQRLIDIAIEPNIRRVLWYPVTKDPDGTIHYAKEEIWEPNYHAALRAITLVHRELRQSSLNSPENMPHGNNGSKISSMEYNTENSKC